jgi:arylsulfatase A-like enzyme
VFILLDTTRADRFGAWGNPRRPTPHLDALAAAGARFARHYANAHATRSSMPQLMSGRYYHPNILRPMHPRSHPREYEFLAGDSGASLLPRVLRAQGYATVGVSAHPWVVAESPFGAGFARLDFLPAPPERGHVEARAVIDRALALWSERPRDRPTLLYVHLMDMHMPRWLSDGAPAAFLPRGWEARFTAGSKPRFGADRRLWDGADALDFTAADRTTFVGIYDTLLSYTDTQVGRLLAALRAEDPGLDQVLVVVVADHGEELGEEGRTDHTGSLADGVQHIPWIVAGAGVGAGQRLDAFSENVDVLPTLLRIVGLGAVERGGAVDGRALIETDGALCRGCAPAAVLYAWENYRAVRSRAELLRVLPGERGEARCDGRERLWSMNDAGRRLLDADDVAAARDVERLRRRLRRLERAETRYRARTAGAPSASFLVPAVYWDIDGETPVACARLDQDTVRGALVAPSGWRYARESFFVATAGAGAPLAVAVTVPDGGYQVDVGVIPLGRIPWLLGIRRWLRSAFRRTETEPATFVPLGAVVAEGGRLGVRIPEAVGLGQRLLALRVTPAGAAPTNEHRAPDDVDPAYRERLRALGYVE